MSRSSDLIPVRASSELKVRGKRRNTLWIIHRFSAIVGFAFAELKLSNSPTCSRNSFVAASCVVGRPAWLPFWPCNVH